MLWLRVLIAASLFIGSTLCWKPRRPPPRPAAPAPPAKCTGYLTFKVVQSWPTGKIVLSTTNVTNVQACIADCHEDTFCNMVGYDFSNQQCVMASKNTGQCTGNALTEVSQDILTDIGKGQGLRISFSCFGCQSKSPSWVNIKQLAPKNIWDSLRGQTPDAPYLEGKFKNKAAGCKVSGIHKLDVGVTTSQMTGRWWLVYTLGQQNVKAMLMDIATQDNDNYIARVVTSRTGSNGDTCTEDYWTWNKLDGNIWQLTMNYTNGNVDKVPWGIPRYVTYIMVCLTVNTNANEIVWYGCMVPFANDTCDPSQTILWAFIRDQALATHTSELKTFDIFPPYICSTEKFRLLNVNDPCLTQYLTHAELYWVRDNCSYTNQTWMSAHSNQPTYEQLVGANWTNLFSSAFGGETTYSYSTTAGQLSATVLLQNAKNDRACVNRDTSYWALNGTGAPQQQTWIQPYNNTIANSVPAIQQQQWNVVFDSVFSTWIGCVGSTPCVNDSTIVAIGMRRYKKRNDYYHRTRLFPVLARACLNPTEIPLVSAVRKEDGLQLCGREEETRNCLWTKATTFSDPNGNFGKFASSYVLALGLTVQPMDGMACQLFSGNNRYTMQCYIKAQGICDGPYKSTIVPSKGLYVFENTDPRLDAKDNNADFVLLYQTDNLLAFYGCYPGGTDQVDKNACREERMQAYVFVTPGYTLSQDDLTKIQGVYDNVCLYTPTQLFPMDTSDPCLAPATQNYQPGSLASSNKAS